MGLSGNARLPRVVVHAAMTGAVVSCVLTAPSGASVGDRVDPRPTLRLAPERDAGVAAVDVPLRSEFEPAGRGRFRTPRIDASRFSMVGFTWPSDDTRLRVRVRADGRWGSWQRAEAMPDIPDPASPEGRRARSGTELVWVGGSDGVQVESTVAPVRGLQMTLIEPGAEPAHQVPRTALQKPGKAPRPNLRSRKAWGANDRLRSGSPRYNRTIQQVHVHHTVNSNGYSRSDVPGLIRGMYRYHTKNLGWSDIGYNFLVDRFGRAWVGRAGGPARAVRGAHTLGFNSTSTGVAVIGNFEVARQAKVVETALVRLAAWKLDRYGRNPKGTVKVYSHGSDRFPAGRSVRLPVIDGHRDTNETACPGAHLYQRLPNVRRRAAERIANFH
jgi:N-acetylmuramoyl-L-alanine amidase-like protein